MKARKKHKKIVELRCALLSAKPKDQPGAARNAVLRLTKLAVSVSLYLFAAQKILKEAAGDKRAQIRIQPSS